MPHRLAIDRIALTGIAAGDHGDRGRLQGALDAIGADRLAAAVAHALGSFGGDDPRVVLLRRLELRHDQAAIDTDNGGRDALVTLIAQGIAAAIMRLGTEPAGPDLIVFPSPPHHLGAFFAALAHGEAWDRWWFRDFDGLRMLPVSAAVRTAFERDPGQGFAALRTLARPALRDVLAHLSDADATAMVATLESDAVVGGEAAAWSDIFTAAAPPPTLRAAAARLWFLTAAMPGGSGRVPRAAFDAIHAREALATIAPERLANLIERHAIDELAALLPGLRQRDLAHVLTLPPELAGAVARDPRPPCAEDVGGYTPFGGLLLLWPHFPETAKPIPSGIALLALAALLGPHRAEFAIGDPVLRATFGVAEHTTRSDLAAATWPNNGWRRHRWRGGASARLPADLHDPAIVALGVTAAADFVRRLPGFTRSSLPFVIANLLDIGADVAITDDAIHARLHRPPLDVLLGMSGLADRTVTLADGRRLILARAR